MTQLQELLNLGLLEIGSDDSRFEKMQLASAALAKRLGEDPHLLLAATLIALDEDVDENDPFFELVEGFVVEEWKTLRNTHVNRPRQLLRSIAVDAVFSLTEGSPEVSGAVWNCAADRLRHKQARLGKAVELVDRLFGLVFESAEAEAVQRAGMGRPKAKRRRRRKLASRPEGLQLQAAISDDQLLGDVARAAGPQHPTGQALQNGPNPHWPNSGQTWASEFNPRMTAALVKAVNLGTSKLASSVSEQLDTHLASMETYLLDQVKSFEALQRTTAQAGSAERMRLDILWWSKARYSPSLRSSYCEVSVAVASFVAALDLSSIVPPLLPASTTYVLGEAVASFGSTSPVPLSEYLRVLAQAQPDLGESLESARPGEDEGSLGRGLLLDLAVQAVDGAAVSDEIIRSRAGIEPNLKLSPADFSMWIFRELQARRIAEDLA